MPEHRIKDPGLDAVANVMSGVRSAVLCLAEAFDDYTGYDKCLADTAWLERYFAYRKA